MLKVNVLNKIPSLYLLKCDKNTLLIAKELLLAGIEETNPDIILQAALFEEMNHKITSFRVHDHLLEFIKPQFNLKKTIPSGELCQILIVAVGRGALLSLPQSDLKRIRSGFPMAKKQQSITRTFGVKPNIHGKQVFHEKLSERVAIGENVFSNRAVDLPLPSNGLCASGKMNFLQVH